MKIKTKLLGLTLLAFAVTAGPSYAQRLSADGKAVIYVYSLAAAVVGDLHRTVYIDYKAAADIQPKRYFIILAKPGTHSLHFKDKKWGGVEKEFKAGETYYLRVGWNEVGWTVKPRGLDLMAAENGSFDIKQLKPIDAENIKDKSLVILEP